MIYCLVGGEANRRARRHAGSLSFVTKLVASNINAADIADKSITLKVLCLAHMTPICGFSCSPIDELREVVYDRLALLAL